LLELPIERYLPLVLVAGARVSGVLLTAPFLGSSSVPPRIKVSIAIVLTALLVPMVPATAVLAMSGLAPLILREMAIGFLLGFTLQFFFEAAQLAGQVLGVQMGFSLASIINPTSDADSAVLSVFSEMVVLLLFIQLQVPHWLIRGLARSFDYLPPGQFSLTWPGVSGLMQFAGGIWVAGVQIAAPVLVATVFTDIALGFLGKASPQMPVLFVGMSLKNVVGLALLVGAVAFWPHFFEARFQQALTVSEAILRLPH
jgi:flagellar biosynthesis protein FliR